MKRLFALAAIVAGTTLAGCAVVPAHPGVYVGPPAVRVVPAPYYYGYRYPHWHRHHHPRHDW